MGTSMFFGEENDVGTDDCVQEEGSHQFIEHSYDGINRNLLAKKKKKIQRKRSYHSDREFSMNSEFDIGSVEPLMIKLPLSTSSDDASMSVASEKENSCEIKVKKLKKQKRYKTKSRKSLQINA